MLGGGFQPGGNMSMSALDLLKECANIRLIPLPPPNECRVCVEAYASGSQGEIQFAGPGPAHHFEASHKLVWLEQESTLQVQEKLNLVGQRPEITINGVPIELPKTIVGGPNIHILETPSVPPTLTISAVPSGDDGEIQFASGGHFPAPQNRFAGDNRLRWDDGRLEVTGEILLNGEVLRKVEPAGSAGQIQFNAGGSPPEFGASQNLFWDDENQRLSVGTALISGPALQVGYVNSGPAITSKGMIQITAQPTYLPSSEASLSMMWFQQSGWVLSTDWAGTAFPTLVQGNPLLLNCLYASNPVGLGSNRNVYIGYDAVTLPSSPALLNVNGTFSVTDPATTIPFFRITDQGRILISAPAAYNQQAIVVESNGTEIGFLHENDSPFGIAGIACANDLRDNAFLYVAGSQIVADPPIAGNFNIVASKDIVFHTATVAPLSGERMRITAGGDVLVRENLDVAGVINANGILLSEGYIQNTGGGATGFTIHGDFSVTLTATYDINLSPTRGITAPNLATSDPGPGSKQFWADPSDGYRVKWAV